MVSCERLSFLMLVPLTAVMTKFRNHRGVFPHDVSIRGCCWGGRLRERTTVDAEADATSPAKGCADDCTMQLFINRMEGLKMERGQDGQETTKSIQPNHIEPAFFQAFYGILDASLIEALSGFHSFLERSFHPSLGNMICVKAR